MATERVRKLLDLAEQLGPRERVELANELLHSVAANDEDELDDDGSGLVTSTLLNLLVVPALYLRYGRRQHDHGAPSQ